MMTKSLTDLLMVMVMVRRQEQALQEAFRRADNSSEGKLTVDDYLKVTIDDNKSSELQKVI